MSALQQNQGCQMAFFRTKNLGKFWRNRNGRCWYIIGIFCLCFTIWYIFWPFGKFYGYFGISFPRFGMLYQGRSGNPEQNDVKWLKRNILKPENVLTFRDWKCRQETS
jgi:hypothetical protein